MINLNQFAKNAIGSLIWATALAVAAYDLSVPLGIAGAFFGGLVGFWLGPVLAKSKLRLVSLIVGGAVVGVIVNYLCSLPIRSSFIAGLFSPMTAYSLSDGLGWLCCSMLGVAVIHACSERHAWFLSLELAVITAILVSPLSGHRDGFISRPHFFVDPLWSRGFDPVPWLLAIGGIVACTLLFLSVGRYNKRGTFADLALLLVLVALIAIFLPLNKLNQLVPEQQLMSQPGQGNQGSPPPPPSGEPDKDQSKDKDKSKSNKNSNQPKPVPVAVVVFYSDYAPADGFYYFRQSANSMYNGALLVEDTTGAVDRDIAKGFPNKEQKSQKLLTPEQVDQSKFVSVATRVSLITNHSKPFGLVNPVKFSAVNNPDPSQFNRAYSVDSLCYTGDLSTLLDLKVGNPKWTKAQWQHYTTIPKDPRYLKTAQEAIKKLPAQYADKPVAKAVMLKLWLESEGTYDASVKIADESDPVASFLFGDKIGYCVHFANSLAYLARSLGIPARVGNGYAADSRYRYEGSALLIQSSNSHAWCEIYVEDLGWVPVDVAPQKSNSQPAAAPDADLQQMLGEMARKETSNEDGEPQQQVDVQQESQRMVGLLGQLAAVLAIASVILAYAIKIWRRFRRHFGSLPTRIKHTFVSALDSLADVGITRTYGDSREQFALDHQQTLEALVSLTAIHMRKALGNQALPLDVDAATLNKYYANLQRQIRRQVPWYKRFLGLLNPISWLFVK